jgi:pimeloyl-ACP methyl ester carboxylesterase
MSRDRSSVLFIHGLWLHPSSWAPWLRLFSEYDYEPSAPGWPGVADTVVETRANPDAMADRGIEEVADHYMRIIDRMDRRPVIIGHSFGGIIAEMLLAQGCAAAVIAIGAVQIDGVPRLPVSLPGETLREFKDPANRHRAVSLTAEKFRDSFANALDERESADLYQRWTIPAPSRPLIEAIDENFSRYSRYSPSRADASRAPELLVVGGKDQTIPESVTTSTLMSSPFRPLTDLLEFPDRGHSLTIDSGWREVAEACIAWLWDEHGL